MKKITNNKVVNFVKNHKIAIGLGIIGVSAAGFAGAVILNKRASEKDVVEDVADTVDNAVDNIDAACASINFDSIEF